MHRERENDNTYTVTNKLHTPTHITRVTHTYTKQTYTGAQNPSTNRTAKTHLGIIAQRTVDEGHVWKTITEQLTFP